MATAPVKLRPVRTVTTVATGNVTIATGLVPGEVVNGITLAEGDEVLLPFQTTATQIGVYTVHDTPARAFGHDDWSEVNRADIYVESGTAYAGTVWRPKNAASGTVGTDALAYVLTSGGYLAKSIAGGAGTTVMTAAEASHEVLELTGAITGNRVVEVPATPTRSFTVFNNTTGAFTVTVKVNGQTGIVVASTKTAVLYSNGTDVERATADA